MTDVGRVRIESELDPSGARRGLDQIEREAKQAGDALERDLGRKGTRAAKDLDQATRGVVARFNDLASSGGIVGGIFQGVGLAGGISAYNLVGDAIGKAVDMAGQMIAKASSLAEAQAKVDAVFGESADAIHAWADTTAEGLGISRTAALQSAGSFGNLFSSLGLAKGAAVDMSRGIVQLAADLSSFNDVGTDEVLAALQSGLLGEAEPMRRFGSNLSAARVEAYALARGMARTKAEITDAMKVQARWNLILEDTVLAQGNSAREADGLAGSTSRLNAQLDDLMADIGTEMIPVMVEFAKVLKDDVVPGLRDLVQMAKDAKPWLDLLGQFNPVNIGEGTRSAVGRVGDAMRSTTQATDALVGAAAGVGHAARDAEDGVQTLVHAWQQLHGAVGEGGAIITEEQQAFIDGLTEMDRAALLLSDSLPDDLRAAIEGAEQVMRAGARGIIRSARTIGPGVSSALRNSRQDVNEAAKQLRRSIENPLKPKKILDGIEARLTGPLIAEAIRKSRRDPRVKSDLDAYISTIVGRLGVLKSMGYDIGEAMGLAIAAAVASNPFIQSITGKKAKRTATWALGGILGGAIGGLGNYADGGEPKAGETAWVGERGPELAYFKPGGGAVITPMTALGVAAPRLDHGAMATATTRSSTVRHEGRVEVVVRDPDGGLARAGISTSGLASELRGSILSTRSSISHEYEAA